MKNVNTKLDKIRLPSRRDTCQDKMKRIATIGCNEEQYMKETMMGADRDGQD